MKKKRGRKPHTQAEPPYVCAGCARPPTVRGGKFVRCKCGAAPHPLWKIERLFGTDYQRE